MDARRLVELSPEERSAIVDRNAGIDEILDDVEAIVDRVHAGGDAALLHYTEEFDGVAQEEIDITDRAAAAVSDLDPDIRKAIDRAAENIQKFHERQLPEDWRMTMDGRELGRRFRPIERVGVYVPGGTAAYPSSALMGIIPAVVAGVDRVEVATPPAAEPNPITLAAIHLAGADRVYAAGGAQSIAAMAYGTESVEAVDKVVGPGNRWVTAAKAVVQGDVAIDFLAGPSEILVIADESADPGYVAADMVAQAEHDPATSVVTVSPDPDLAQEIVQEINRQVDDRTRADIIREAIENDASGVFVTDTMNEAIEFAEEYAAEHLSIQATADEEILEQIDSAGSVFLGPFTPVAAGDYASGTNHVLPTGGAAKVTGGLSVDTFLRASTVQRLESSALEELRDTITTLAGAEGLEAHAASVDARFPHRRQD